MPDREEIERAIEAVFASAELQDAGLKQRRALKLLDQGVWEGTVTPFHQARAEQRDGLFLTHGVHVNPPGARRQRVEVARGNQAGAARAALRERA
jgi:hypothetical protein